MHPRAILARNLRDLRKLRGLSQEALAHEAEISRQYVSDIERELYSASVDMLAALAAVLKVRPSELIDERFSVPEAGETSDGPTEDPAKP